MKTFFETSCFTIFAYSNLRKHLTLLNEENYIQFVGTEVQIMTFFKGNNRMILSDILPRKTDSNNETILFVSAMKFLFGREDGLAQEHVYVQEQIMISEKLKEVQKLNKNLNFVLLCMAFSPLCFESRKWLPKQNVIYYNQPSTKYRNLNPHLQEILIDLMYNPNYNWRERYTLNLEETECLKHLLNRSSVSLWQIKSEDLGVNFLNEFIYNYFSDYPGIVIYTSGTMNDSADRTDLNFLSEDERKLADKEMDTNKDGEVSITEYFFWIESRLRLDPNFRKNWRQSQAKSTSIYVQSIEEELQNYGGRMFLMSFQELKEMLAKNENGTTNVHVNLS